MNDRKPETNVDSPMRVGIYKDTLANRRGADMAVCALAEGLRERGLDAVLFEKTDLSRRIAERWDVFISTGTNELLDISAFFPRKFPWPVIQQFHTNPKAQFKRKHMIRNWKAKRALRRVNAIQVLGAEFVPQAAEWCADVEAIGNWSSFSPLTATEDAENLIIYPAAIAKGKNQKLLIEAFALLAAEFPKWRVRLLGKTGCRYAEECRKLAIRMGISDRVGFPGFSDSLASEYVRCAFVAFPSVDEGFGLAIADAAVFGKPCVMVRDWIGTAAAGGGIVTKPSAAEYAGGLRRLMSDASLGHEMGCRARRFCGTSYSRDEILDRWVSLIFKVATASGGENMVKYRADV